MTAYTTVLAALVLLTNVAAAQSGSGTTTRYWFVFPTFHPYVLTFLRLQGLLQALLRVVNVRHHITGQNVRRL